MIEWSQRILGVPAWGWLVAGLVLLAILLLALGWRLRRWWQAVRLGRSRRQGARGERESHRLLEEAGYRVVSTQSCVAGHLAADGERVDFDVRFDAVVERDGRRYVAEVKTGAAASVSRQATRRQLLEYAYVLGVDAVLLVDMASCCIVRIDFPGPGVANGALERVRAGP